MSPLLLINIPDMVRQEEVVRIVEDLLEGTGKYLVEVLIQPANRITVYFDGDQNVSISDCQLLSRQIEEKLDKEPENFELNVSSPGLDRPIRLHRQYQKRIGRELEIVLLTGERVTGILVRADEKSVELEHPVRNPKKETLRPNSVISFDNIKSAKNIISFGK
jgi:ribosome maturation factor RimP